MRRAVSVILVVCLLGLHAPVCKTAVVARPDAPAKTPPVSTCSCSKCAKPRPAPEKRKPAGPSKPACPPTCSLCSVSPALIPDPSAVPTGDALVIDRLPRPSQLAAEDGFHCPIDRPPRA